MKFAPAFVFPVVIAVLAAGVFVASADDMVKPDAGVKPVVPVGGGAPVVPGSTPITPSDAPAVQLPSQSGVIVFGGGVASVHVDRDAAAGKLTFRLADPATKTEGEPVVVIATESGSKEVKSVAVTGESGVWTWSSDRVKADRLDAMLQIVVAGTTYTSPLSYTTMVVWGGPTPTLVTTNAPAIDMSTGMWKPRFGGNVVALTECNFYVEIVHNPATGMLTIYSFDDNMLTDAPVISINATDGAKSLTMMKSEGQKGVWWTKHELFKALTTPARIRLTFDGKACEGPLVYGSSRGGRWVMVAGGPNFEVVRDAKEGYFTFYANEELLEGKPYTIETPTVVVNGRTFDLRRVDGEPRAWRLVGLDASAPEARAGQFNFTLSGRPMTARVGFWSAGNGAARGSTSSSGVGDSATGKGTQNGGTGTQGSGAK